MAYIEYSGNCFGVSVCGCSKMYKDSYCRVRYGALSHLDVHA